MEHNECATLITWEEVLKSSQKVVTAKSYGFMERGLFGHFEPFSHQHNIIFTINRDYKMLENSTFWLDDNESDLDFYQESDGTIYLQDPDISSRPCDD